MVDRRPGHSRLVATTRRRIVPFDLVRADQHGQRPIKTSGLVATIPDERTSHRPTI